MKIAQKSSSPAIGTPAPRRSPGAGWHWPALFLSGCLLYPDPVASQTTPGTTPPNPPPVVVAQRRLEDLRRQFTPQSTNVALAWQLGQACFDRAELAASDAEREALGLEGIESCRRATELSPTNAPAHYYLALNIGQVARTRRLSALKLVREMETELLETSRLDERLDYAGADRALALLYRDAPGWPVSVGSHKQARRHFQRAITVDPDYPGNRMAWAEFLVAEGEWDDAREQVRLLDALWERARQRLSGPEWASSWVEWQARLERIRSRLEEKAPPARGKPAR